MQIARFSPISRDVSIVAAEKHALRSACSAAVNASVTVRLSSEAPGTRLVDARFEHAQAGVIPNVINAKTAKA
jgi:hypothetical protein